MFCIRVSFRDGTQFIYVTDSEDLADCRMAELRRDPNVRSAYWLHSLMEV